jgi:hypothetical protein
MQSRKEFIKLLNDDDKKHKFVIVNAKYCMFWHELHGWMEFRNNATIYTYEYMIQNKLPTNGEWRVLENTTR